MRRSLILLALCAAMALPAAAQNTDIESLSGLQFNFGNPGARSLGMGGAFLGLADDASAAEANPAGLTILRKPEISFEARNYLEQQVLTTSGTYPDLERTAFTHYSSRAEITFASFVMPFKNHFAIAGYYHEPLRNVGAGSVVPVRNQFSGKVEKNVPTFFLPAAGGPPITAAQCTALRNQTGNPAACIENPLKPFLTAVDVQQKTLGLSGAWQIGNFSIGAGARYQRFRENALTFRVTSTFDFDTILVQSTGKLKNNNFENHDAHDVTFSGGIKWAPNDKWSFGAAYKQGAQFDAPLYGAFPQTNLEYIPLADTRFHIPDVAGVGISFRPIPVLTINADAQYVKYSNLTDDFVSIYFQTGPAPYKAKNATELHVGGEYFFATKVPFAVRGGYWRDPAHAVEYTGGLTTANGVAAAILYPKAQTQNHYSVGAGLAWPRFQVDAAYDTSEHYKVGSISFVTRF